MTALFTRRTEVSECITETPHPAEALTVHAEKLASATVQTLWQEHCPTPYASQG